MTQLIGRIFHNRYRIESLLGRQTGRRTFLATDLRTGASVVIKLLLFGPDFTWSDLKLFEREAAVLKSLDHNAIPKYLDSFEVETEIGKGFALVQSYIKAKSLQEWIQSGRTFSESELREIATSLLKTLDYLHQRHPAVVHRDIKPSNILMSDRSWWHSGQVYLVDFGSVQAADQSGTRTVVGTYGYMPPEQFGGQTVPASDLYALGATLIYLASGQSPDQLPQRGMRLLFENQVALKSHWIDWLKWLTEPSLDRRLTSAKQALEALQQSPSSANTLPLPVQPTVSKQHLILEPHVDSLQSLSGVSAQPLATQPVDSIQSVSSNNSRGLFYALLGCSLLGLGGIILLVGNDSPKSVDFYLTEGDSFYQNKDYDRAIADYNQALRLDPKNVNAYYDRGGAFDEKQDYDRAIADFNQALRLDPKNVDTYINRGRAFDEKQDYDRAIVDFNQALRLDPENVIAYINRGRAFYQKQDYNRATADYNQALRLDPKNVIAYYNRGLAYAYGYKNSNEAAMADYNETLRLDPNYVDAYIQRGIIFGEKKDYDRAMANFNQALRLDPKNVNAYVQRGLAYLGKDSNEPAMADFNQALTIDPNYAYAYYYRGLAYRDKGSKKEALEDLKKFVNLTDDAELKQKAQKEILLLRSMK